MATVILIPGRKESFANYSSAVEAVGGQVVFSEEPARLPSFDGLLLPGGGDVEPWRYGMENTASRDMDSRRDALEFAVLERSLTAGVPILGICRGAQVINAALGGTLQQDLPGHSRAEGADRLHHAWGVPSFLTELYGSSVIVNSAHHQAVELPADQLRPVQWAPDGTVEAMEHECLPVWCVQWHPERLCGSFAKRGAADGDLLFQAFLKRCQCATKKCR